MLRREDEMLSFVRFRFAHHLKTVCDWPCQIEPGLSGQLF